MTTGAAVLGGGAVVGASVVGGPVVGGSVVGGSVVGGSGAALDAGGVAAAIVLRGVVVRSGLASCSRVVGVVEASPVCGLPTVVDAREPLAAVPGLAPLEPHAAVAATSASTIHHLRCRPNVVPTRGSWIHALVFGTSVAGDRRAGRPDREPSSVSRPEPRTSASGIGRRGRGGRRDARRRARVPVVMPVAAVFASVRCVVVAGATNVAVTIVMLLSWPVGVCDARAAVVAVVVIAARVGAAGRRRCPIDRMLVHVTV
ncbi:MAG TPA: hypothetical protein VGI86_01465, partial [Acidimicrobiia bacterium]